MAFDALIPWLVFGGMTAALLVIDLTVFNRGARVQGVREALLWTAGWVSLGLLFGVGVWALRGGEIAQQYYAGFLIEKALSVDNLFVFVMVFAALGIAPEHQRKVLFWGVLGAIVFRLIFILGGVALIERFEWVMYIFGVVLLVTAFKMWRSEEVEADPEKNPLVRLVERVFPVDCTYRGERFALRRAGAWVLTPLALALVAIESADLVFAIDSVPAVLAVSRDPFIVFTSNVFAILGLRSLYFALAGCIQRFRYLHYGLAIVLGFVGVKMLVVHWVHVPVGLSLAFIGTTVLGSVALSWWRTSRDAACELPAAEPATDAA